MTEEELIGAAVQVPGAESGDALGAGAPCGARVDLHVHTTTSDGSDTFEDVLAQAAARGIKRIAFTNHDTTRGLGSCFGIEVIGGIEISAYDFARGRKVHVLGYGLADDAPAIAAL